MKHLEKKALELMNEYEKDVVYATSDECFFFTFREAHTWKTKQGLEMTTFSRENLEGVETQSEPKRSTKPKK